MRSKLAVLILVVALTFAAVAPGTAAPQAGPCAAGTGYDPACDVNHDGMINVLDIQLAAGHWNQSGAYTSDNDHNHLGQTWTGSNNPLIIGGSFGAPNYAPLRLSNTAGNGVTVGSASSNGVVVSSAGADGIAVVSAGDDGIQVVAAGDDGIFVNAAGNPSSQLPSTGKNGFEVAGAQGNGLYVGWADQDGVKVDSAGEKGVFVRWAGDDGLYVWGALATGVNVAGNHFAGYFVGNITVTGNCTGCLLATFGVNTSGETLALGDVVSLAGLRESGLDSVPMLLEVQLAKGGAAVVGVVQGWAELVTEDEPRPTEIGLRLAPREGAAGPGQYVTIAYSGLAQVKASGPVAQGSKLAAGENGAARALRTVIVDGVELAESGAVIGTALESLDAADGLIWVLVNVQ